VVYSETVTGFFVLFDVRYIFLRDGTAFTKTQINNRYYHVGRRTIELGRYGKTFKGKARYQSSLIQERKSLTTLSGTWVSFAPFLDKTRQRMSPTQNILLGEEVQVVALAIEPRKPCHEHLTLECLRETG